MEVKKKTKLMNFNINEELLIKFNKLIKKSATNKSALLRNYIELWVKKMEKLNNDKM